MIFPIVCAKKCRRPNISTPSLRSVLQNLATREHLLGVILPYFMHQIPLFAAHTSRLDWISSPNTQQILSKSSSQKKRALKFNIQCSLHIKPRLIFSIHHFVRILLLCIARRRNRTRRHMCNLWCPQRRTYILWRQCL